MGCKPGSGPDLVPFRCQKFSRVQYFGLSVVAVGLAYQWLLWLAEAF